MWRWRKREKMCEDVWRCMKMCRCEDLKMWRCEDEKMWRWEDEKIWRWEDEKMWWRYEHVKMYSRPPLLEEPFAQTLSGKRPQPSQGGATSGSGNWPGINISGWHLPWVPQPLENSGEMCFAASLLLIRSFCIFSLRGRGYVDPVIATFVQFVPIVFRWGPPPSASLVSCPGRLPSFCRTLVRPFLCLGCSSGDVLLHHYVPRMAIPFSLGSLSRVIFWVAVWVLSLWCAVSCSCSRSFGFLNVVQAFV